MRTVSLMTANREFSSLIREVERGEGVSITRRRRPIAKLAPHSTDKTTGPEWMAAYRRMMAQFDEGGSLGGMKVLREDLYDR